MGFDDEAATQVAVVPVGSGTHFEPGQHGAKPVPQGSASLLHMHAPKRSPWAMCAGIDCSLTLISCAFVGLPGGRWQICMFAAATRGMRAVAANTKNAAHIVRVLSNECRG